MAKVELKQPIVDEISGVIKDAQSVVVVDYRGLTVSEDTQLRKQLREAGVSYKVYKNTLVSRAVEGTEFESLRDVLEGPSAFAVSADDATAPARVLAKFAKTAPALEIKAGVVEGTYSIQMNHINMNQLGWNQEQGQRSAQEMYDLIFNMKFLPPGRGLYCMGTDIVCFLC